MNVHPLPLARAAVLLALAAGLGSAATAADFSGGAPVSQTLSSAILEPASGLTATTGCSLLSGKVDLSWTVTPSAFADGYRVERWQGSTLESTTTVTPRTVTTLTQTGLATNTTYTWKMRATEAEAWTSTEVSATATTPLVCLV